MHASDRRPAQHQRFKVGSIPCAGRVCHKLAGGAVDLSRGSIRHLVDCVIGHGQQREIRHSDTLSSVLHRSRSNLSRQRIRVHERAAAHAHQRDLSLAALLDQTSKRPADLTHPIDSDPQRRDQRASVPSGVGVGIGSLM